MIANVFDILPKSKEGVAACADDGYGRRGQKNKNETFP